MLFSIVKVFFKNMKAIVGNREGDTDSGSGNVTVTESQLL
jgi:hypothetical protein